MSENEHAPGLSVHRVEALTDGIYAVAMTLLVIELKLPEAAVHGDGGIAQALAGLAPKAISWTISFFVLAFFWYGHHRAFSHVRRADGTLVALNLAQLALASLMPFSCALVGEHQRELLSQVIYSGNMAGLAVIALLTSRYIHRHRDAALMGMPAGAYRGAQWRLFGLVLVSLVAVGIHLAVPGAGNAAFMLMALIMPLSRRVERASDRAVPRPAPG